MAGSAEQSDPPGSPEAGSLDAMDEETPGPQANHQESQLSQAQWAAIKQITDNVYKYRTEELVRDNIV